MTPLLNQLFPSRVVVRLSQIHTQVPQFACFPTLPVALCPRASKRYFSEKVWEPLHENFQLLEFATLLFHVNKFLSLVETCSLKKVLRLIQASTCLWLWLLTTAVFLYFLPFFLFLMGSRNTLPIGLCYWIPWPDSKMFLYSWSTKPKQKDISAHCWHFTLFLQPGPILVCPVWKNREKLMGLRGLNRCACHSGNLLD